MKNIIGNEALFRFNLKSAAFLLVAAIIAVAGIKGSSKLFNRVEEEGIKNLQNAVQRSIVQCYALEGQYPVDVEYLEQNYGLQIDHSKYLIDYNNFASNVMPQATVIPLTDGEEQ